MAQKLDTEVNFQVKHQSPSFRFMPALSTASPAPIATSEGLVCVVDDDPAVRRSLERLLRSSGFRVETFPSARAYLQSAAPKGPYCVVSDLQMPGIDGLELQSALAESHAQVVFLTGHGNVPTCAT